MHTPMSEMLSYYSPQHIAGSDECIAQSMAATDIVMLIYMKISFFKIIVLFTTGWFLGLCSNVPASAGAMAIFDDAHQNS